MTEARGWAAAAYHPDVGFLITGGYGYDWSYLSSTEVTTDGTNFQVDGVFGRGLSASGWYPDSAFTVRTPLTQKKETAWSSVQPLQ